MKFKFQVALVALLIVGLGAMHSFAQTSKPAEKSGDKKKVEGPKAPDFELKDLDGKKTYKLSDYKDKIVVLEWTEPGCPYVERHYNSKNMQTLAKKWGDEVVWLSIWSGSKKPDSAMKEFMKRHGVEHVILRDKDGSVGKSYKARTTPHMYVINQGVKIYEGAIDDDKYGKKGGTVGLAIAHATVGQILWDRSCAKR